MKGDMELEEDLKLALAEAKIEFRHIIQMAIAAKNMAANSPTGRRGVIGDVLVLRNILAAISVNQLLEPVSVAGMTLHSGFFFKKCQYLKTIRPHFQIRHDERGIGKLFAVRKFAFTAHIGDRLLPVAHYMDGTGHSDFTERRLNQQLVIRVILNHKNRRVISFHLKVQYHLKPGSRNT